MALIQGCVLLVAVVWGWTRGVAWWEGLRWTPWALTGVPLGLGMMAVTTLLSKGVQELVDEVMYPLFRSVGVLAIIFASASSGFAEEVLFRGVMQPDLGIVWTSVIFGVLHTGDRRLLVLGPWAALASVVLGWAYVASGTLWCPILAHFTNNLCSMVYLRFFYKPCHESPDDVSMGVQEGP